MVASDGAQGDACTTLLTALQPLRVRGGEPLFEGGAFLFSRAPVGSQRYPSQWAVIPGDWAGSRRAFARLSWPDRRAVLCDGRRRLYGDRRIRAVRALGTASVFSAHMRLHALAPRACPTAERNVPPRRARVALPLAAYLWRTVEEASATGLPVQRAMALACRTSPRHGPSITSSSAGDLLVAPASTRRARARLSPDGEWPLPAAMHSGRTHARVRAGARRTGVLRGAAPIPLGPPCPHRRARVAGGGRGVARP